MSAPRLIGCALLGFALLTGGRSAVAAAGPSAPSANPAPADLGAQLAAAKMRRDIGSVLNFVRAYEPNELGLTKDKSDELFMDFKFSVMFPLYGDYADQVKADANPRWQVGPFDSRHTTLFFSATIRGGQYIWTRPSAPVVEKRFNPQAFTRFWFVDGGKTSLDRYIDVIYGHESNGQSINSLDRFNEQREIFRKLEKNPETDEARRHAVRSARDAISRGWDYVGTEFSWNWQRQTTLNNRPVDLSRVAKIKARHFLDYGLLQRGAEEYNAWEEGGGRHRREDFDGLMLQYTSALRVIAEGIPAFTGRYTVTYTTGLAQPLRHSTLELELGAVLWKTPISLWVRRGYNSDLIDYYKVTQSYGGKISIWQF